MTSEIIQSAVLGLVQGLGEFLPISSSAHLAIFPWLFGFSDPGLSFDVALHLGTLAAVLAYFWRDWLEILKLAFQDGSRPDSDGENPKFKNGYTKNTLWFLAAATVPGALIGAALEDKAETVFRNPLLIAAALGVMGLALYLVDKNVRHKKGIRQVGWKDALIIGFSQAIAIIPGISRSGITIMAGLACGLDRVGAARFSFLLSTPIIFGAAILKVPQLLQSGITAQIAIGISVAAISGYLAIKFLMRFVEKTSYAVFFWYRLAFASLILAVYIFRI